MSEVKKRQVPPEFEARVGLETVRGVKTINDRVLFTLSTEFFHSKIN